MTPDTPPGRNPTATPDVWHGGYYELAIELGQRDDERLVAALRAVWQFPALDGCYARRDIEPAAQERYEPSLHTLESGRGMHGILTLPEDGAHVACGVTLVRDGERESDWLVFFLPMGSLGNVRAVGAFPFGETLPSRPWREPLDRLLIQIAHRVHAGAPFRLALIGHEVSGETDAATVIAAGGVPSERWFGYLFTAEPERPLEWFAPTIYDAPYSFSRVS